MMDLSEQPNASDLKESRNFHSNHHLSSQHRKISIGILVNSFCKNSGPKNVSANDSLVVVDEDVAPSKAKSTEDGNRTATVLSTVNKGKQTEATGQETSPLWSYKSFSKKLPTAEQVIGAEMICILPVTRPITETQNAFHVAKVQPANLSVHYFGNHMSGLESSKGSHRKFDGNMPEMREITGEGSEKLSFSTLQKVGPEKDVVEDRATKGETRGSENLRLKLWEILGTISSPNQQHPNDCDLGVGAKNMNLVQKEETDSKLVLKRRQNSDTIESDSEDHDCHGRRPRTCSMARNRASNKLRETKSNGAESTRSMKDNQEKHASFQERFSTRQHSSTTGGKLAVMRKKNEKWSTGIKSRIMRFDEHANQGHDQKVKNRGKRRPVLQNLTPGGHEVGDKSKSYKRIRKDLNEPKKGSVKTGSHKVHVEEVSEPLRNVIDTQKLRNSTLHGDEVGVTTLHGDEVGVKNDSFERIGKDPIEPKNVSLETGSHKALIEEVSEHLSQKLQKDMDLHKDVSYALLKSISAKKFCIPSPTSGVKMPKETFLDFSPSEMRMHATRSFPGPPSKTKLGEADDDSPEKLMSNTEGIRSFNSFFASKLTCDKSDSESTSSDDLGGLEDSSNMKSRPIVEYPGSRLSSSSSEGSGSETSKEYSHVKGFRESELFPEVDTSEKPAFVLHLNKKHQYQKTIEVSGFSPIIFSRKRIGDYNNVQQHLELNEGDGLASAVTLFALALERVKIKMQSMIKKRSAEILNSVAEGLHMQLQTAESQIQADMGKLTSLTKSKRKHLEMRFEELQGQLNIIYTKFKEEVHQHLQDCRDTVEGLDAYQMELRGTLEKQSASHRKLLLQAEEEIETQLNDAGRSIMNVHNLARERMLQLRNAVADCFNEGND